jgi:hypothetical protein
VSVHVREHFRPDEGLGGQQDAAVREDVRSLVSDLNVTLPSEVVQEVKKKDNVITLAPGSYGGFSLEKADTLLQAMGPGSEINRQVSISQDCVVDGVTFVNSDPDHTGVLVKVNATSTVIFRGCVFNRTSTSLDASLVEFTSGGRGIFVGCLFRGEVSAATQVVANPGAAANVQMVASYNKTGGALAQVTSTAVLS